ncbi:MAG: endonuclease III [Opitutaceae bacterium]|nr:endonuclease III [Cytophagales bacterium]
MTRKERYKNLITYFSEHQPTAETELLYTNAYELLVAVVLSAQCTDKRVNMHTPKLFNDFPDPEALAKCDYDTLFPYIKSISFPGNKTKHLLGLAKMLVEKYNSIVPETIEQLQELPGVGRKTANVIVSVIYNQPAMAVDTHVFRVSKRLGLVDKNAKTPLDVELVLVKHIQKEFIARSHHWLILHGRYICVARNPKCEICPLTEWCKYFESLKKGKTESHSDEPGVLLPQNLSKKLLKKS